MPTPRTTAEREAITRAVLEAPASWSLQRVGALVGLHRDSVRRIQCGLMNADVATDLPRRDPGASRRTCAACLHFTPREIRLYFEGAGIGRCDFGIPESSDLAYARECNSYWPAPAEQG